MTVTVTVEPAEFRLVLFDAPTIAAFAAEVAGRLGLDGLEVRITVDETTPLARIRAASDGDGVIVVHAESGAFEDTRRPRHLAERAVAESVGRALARWHDRRQPGFAGAPADDELSLAQVAAWETAIGGRLERVGVAVSAPRWRYHFRLRHGFTDEADRVFDRLWASPPASWAELDAASRQALAARQAAA